MHVVEHVVEPVCGQYAVLCLLGTAEGDRSGLSAYRHSGWTTGASLWDVTNYQVEGKETVSDAAPLCVTRWIPLDALSCLADAQ